MNIFFQLIYFSTIPALYWILHDDETDNRRKITVILLTFFYSFIALLSIAGEEKVLYHFGFIAFPLIYSILFKRHIRKVFRPPLNTATIIIVTFFLLLFEEFILSIDHVMNNVYVHSPASIFTHLVSYFGFYLGLTLTITFFYKKWHFSLWSLFTAGGIWGVLIEREFHGIKMLLGGEIFNFIIFVSFVFPTYGLYLVGPRLLFSEEFLNNKKSSWQSLLLFSGIVLVPLIFWALFTWLFEIAGFDFGDVI